MPSTCRRPSFVRPPAAPKMTMFGAGEFADADDAPPAPGVTMFGMSDMIPAYDRTAGISLIISLLRVVCRPTLWTSTSGDSPVTTTVSWRAPTLSSALIVATKVPASVMSSRRTVLKPGSEKVRLYVPPRSWLIRYWPSASVVAVRTRSIRSGLAASTVTPGSTPPDASLTTPVLVAWARATEGASTSNPTNTTQIAQTWRMNTPRNETLGVLIA